MLIPHLVWLVQIQIKLENLQLQLQLSELGTMWQLLQHLHYLVSFGEFTNAQGL